MKILDRLKKQVLIYDGAMGTMLQEMGLKPGSPSEEWNLLCPERILEVHRAYADAGADIVETNTFGGNRLSLTKYGLEKYCYEINYKAVKNAKKVGAYVAGSVGPLPCMVTPLGKITFDEAYNIFKEQIKALSDAGPDLIIFETFSDIKELKIAIIAARDVTRLPIQAQLTYTTGGTTISGTSPEVSLAVLEGLGVEIIGANCSLGPKELLSMMKRITSQARQSTYLSVLPNAGLPEVKEGKTYYTAGPRSMALYSERFYRLGVNLVGGCCGTTPSHISAIAETLKGKMPVRRKRRRYYLAAASRTEVVEFAPRPQPYIIGERINPTRRGILQEELRQGGTKLIRESALMQVADGAQLLDVNISVPGLDEVNTMGKVINIVQQTTKVPLVIDSSNPKVLEEGLKQSAGKPLVNSVNGERNKLKQILPLIKKYGAAVIALAMDSQGIPMTKSGRIKIARRIINSAVSIGIKKEDILVDCLVLAKSAEPGGAEITLKTVRQAKKLGWQTILGISNISFGLPERPSINKAFLKMAVKNGLTCAIINPSDIKVKKYHKAERILLGEAPVLSAKRKGRGKTLDELLYNCILTGDKENIKGYIEEALKKGRDPFIINQEILIPALEEVGMRFEKREYFLPQLLLSAETMKIAAAILDSVMPKEKRQGKARILMATVKGDLHDIGKNIVCAILRNYGYTILDLGRNVSAKRIINTAKNKDVDIIGLSCLMTTTMNEMPVVINELKRQGLSIPTILGGAVITPSFAKKAGAKGYAKDAVSAVREVKRLMRESSLKHQTSKQIRNPEL